MKLRELLPKNLPLGSDANPEITSLTYDSRQVTPGALFFALKGENFDGNRFIPDAIKKGAVAIVSEGDPSVTTESNISPVPIVKVKNARLAMAETASAFYSHPSHFLKIAAVTGTNGKTTTTFLIQHICSKSQLPCGLVGTVADDTGTGLQPAVRTTPEAPDVQEMFAQMRAHGLRACALEASSHASIFYRLHGIEFDTFVFTNLTQDHLDFHKTLDAYFNAKAAFFEQLPSQTKKHAKAIINADDRYGHLLIGRLGRTIPIFRYGFGVNTDFRASDLRFDTTGTAYQLQVRGKSYYVRLPLIGMFNVYNSLAALATARGLGLELRAAIAALATSPQVPGRMERIQAKRSFQVFVDYAHTEDALRNVLHTLKELRPSRLIVLFGCGGNRDQEKRPSMARAAEELADWIILTSDNPRKENPEAIIAEVKKGFLSTRYECIPDRETAIHHAIAMAQPGDILLIAGKGHEKYQEFSDHKVPFDDVAIAGRAIADKPVS